MRKLIDDREYATRIGSKAQTTVRERFNIKRFIDDWEAVLESVINKSVYEQTDSVYK